MWISFIIAVTMLAATAAGDDISFVCDFERDTCGFTNQEGLGARWERREMELDDKKGYMMVLEQNSTTDLLGKIMTPYFELDNGIRGCFSFDYYASGNLNFAVEQERNFGIIPVYVKNSDQTSGWQTPRFDVEIDESTRFIFEVVIHSTEQEALVAVDNMRLELKEC